MVMHINKYSATTQEDLKYDIIILTAKKKSW